MGPWPIRPSTLRLKAPSRSMGPGPWKPCQHMYLHCVLHAVTLAGLRNTKKHNPKKSWIDKEEQTQAKKFWIDKEAIKGQEGHVRERVRDRVPRARARTGWTGPGQGPLGRGQDRFPWARARTEFRGPGPGRVPMGPRPERDHMGQGQDGSWSGPG